MSITDLSFFNLASDRLSWLSARQKVTAENIANANTPDYRAKDVSGFAEMLQGSRTGSVRLATTDPRHITGSGGPANTSVREGTDRASVIRTIDGNGVDLEDQAIRAAEIADQHRLATELYRKGFEMLSMSVRKR
ncbi:flagellar basal-body rod protein FlgB [Palleronia salina]|uniref:Flagellar basal body rod protein FlgB n=1 Tax=Palleronia salina TaxID=313368 RepID=A0A1M6CWA3_9RHOB|nr:flagellar basal body rod protein FlgB [Palleronia salina]SHI65287.1 flagellar basal-body rod protein FlgB [Palleronia salina]